MKQTVKDQPVSDRPREKLLRFGVDYLTTHELLMILLGSGNKLAPVQTLAQKIEKLYVENKAVSLNDLLKIKGVGSAKASQIVAAMEIAERLRPAASDEVLDSVEKVRLHLFDLTSAQREHVVCLYLNARMRLVARETLCIGTLNQVMITPADVFGVIKHQPVMFFILAHNHPSGDVTPSSQDLEFTTRMKAAGEILGVKLLDHIIIGKKDSFSFRNAGKL